ncbi:MAG: nucleotidyl transferase AbiEii/AbiGii toxin family protein [Chloroflexi bacterium]|nr:nucleotidyl transferase AbiEii/AbiGii toxin family protein [Chloroflexota bacterium]
MRRAKPASVRSLQARIANIVGRRSGPMRSLELAVADVVVGQMLPGGAAKGGGAMMLRVGYRASRTTRDLDVARPPDWSVDEFVERLAERLRDGWAGFSGTVGQLPAHMPPDMPAAYVMRPFDVTLDFLGRRWTSVRLEIGHDELGGVEDSSPRMAQEMIDVFMELGLPEPAAVPVISTELQIAQKLHACTAVGTRGDNDRARDLVDIQILMATSEPDIVTMRRLASRLFVSRREQSWPPRLEPGRDWPTLYAAAAGDLDVLAFHDAMTWTRALIERIAGSSSG